MKFRRYFGKQNIEIRPKSIKGLVLIKNIKISSYVLMLILFFLLMDFVGYGLLYRHISADEEKDTKILFYEIKGNTSDIISKLFQEYSTQKELLIEKHKIVEDYLNTQDFNVSLDDIYQKINEGHRGKPYNIYITDKNLVIRNTTYSLDNGYDLSFAKNTFEAHKADNTIGCSLPICVDPRKEFLSFTDSYLTKNGDDRAAILQVSYSYSDTLYAFSKLQKLIKKYPSIVDIKSYGINGTGYIYDIILKETDTPYKPDIRNIVFSQKEVSATLNKLKHLELVQDTYTQHGKHYKSLYMSTQSPSNKDIKIIYSILLDESEYYNQLDKLNLAMILLSISGVIGIIFAGKLRNKETKLTLQDQFVQNAMHEIKTPLSIITLNNELRQLEYGKDTYSEEIDSALRVLHNSYNSMSFVVTKDHFLYEIEILDLAQIVKERIDYFQTIARANEKNINQTIDSQCSVAMSRIELIRLLDNNLSNAIKYTRAGTNITVLLDENRLTFHSFSEPIRDKEKIFHHYFRENNTVGGYGLGLGIIRDIAKKYNINISLQSDTSNGTTFTYIFKCHTNVIL